MTGALPLSSTEELVWAGGQQVMVTYASLDQHSGVQRRLIGCCSPAERQRASRHVRQVVARDRLVARGLLRAVLAERLGVSAAAVALDRTAAGKPCLTGPGPVVRFSLSHSAGVVAICLHDRRDVGIDLEHRGRRLDVDLLVRTLVPQAEASSIPQAGPHRHDVFLRWWTRREALGKAAGRGLDWRTAGGTGAWLRPGRVEGSWALLDLDAPAGFFAAVAAHDPATPRSPGRDSPPDVSRPGLCGPWGEGAAERWCNAVPRAGTHTGRDPTADHNPATPEEKA